MAASLLALIAFAIGAAVCILATAWLMRCQNKARRDRNAAASALIASGVWCVLVAALGAAHPAAGYAEIIRNLAWLYALFRLFSNDGRDATLRLVRPAVCALALAELMQVSLLWMMTSRGEGISEASLVFETSAILRVLLSIGALVLIHNLYVGAARESRLLLRWNAAAMLCFWAFGMNYAMIEWLVGSPNLALDPVQALVLAVSAALLGAGSGSAAHGLQFRPSRSATFHFLSLAIISGYLVAMGLASRWLTEASADTARLIQIAVLVAATALIAAWLPSRKLRGWLRVTLLKHLFEHRYDYRAEWLRFTRTISQNAENPTEALPERAIKAIADLTDSPGGLLFTKGESWHFECTAAWNWQGSDRSVMDLPLDLVRSVERDAIIVDLDKIRQGRDYKGEGAYVPDWLRECGHAWAAVPLMHFERLVGIVVLARPSYDRSLDWEDFDLMAIVGRQLASYLAEQAGQAALLEAARFDEFNRRMAFVMHDIKNLSSQMSLLTRNAEKHADKAEFRKDMLVTLRNSADKLNTLLARLGRYGTTSKRQVEPFDLRDAVSAVRARFSAYRSISLLRSEAAEVIGDGEGVEQALAHIVQNAIDASPVDSAIAIEIYTDGLHGKISVIDSGGGMSAAFIREGLFKPFVSSKEGGFGIGAYEAREIVRGMGGRLDVESREGLGSRFTISLPLQSAQRMLDNVGINGREAA